MQNQVITLELLAEAKHLIGVNPDTDITTTLKHYAVATMVAVENGDGKVRRPLTEAKNVLLREEIRRMVSEKGYFDLTGLIPYDNICTHCKGTGELYKFYRTTKTVTCKFCDSGKVPCNKCVDGKLPDGKTCWACKGEKLLSCRKCKGTAKIVIAPIAPVFERHDHCYQCKGRGFIVPEEVSNVQQVKVVQPFNPVIEQLKIE